MPYAPRNYCNISVRISTAGGLTARRTTGKKRQERLRMPLENKLKDWRGLSDSFHKDII
jgi:hypothetical protein